MIEQTEIGIAQKTILCKTCNDPFTPTRGFNGIVQSRDCNSCRFKVNMAQRQALKFKVPEIAYKSKVSTVLNLQIGEKSTCSKKKTGKRLTEKGLKDKLDRIFSLFIRHRDSKDGAFKCISCGQIKSYSLADCGHYINRANMTTRFDEINCNAQCSHCNRFREGNNQGYRKGLIKKYGEPAIEMLEMKKHNTSNISSAELRVMIDLYSSKLKAFDTPEKGNIYEGNNF